VSWGAVVAVGPSFLEIYDQDVIYASGLAGCMMIQIAGSPANNIAPDVSGCITLPNNPTWLSVLVTQGGLDLASLSLFLTAEPPLFP
jgi:hypothetical protein